MNKQQTKKMVLGAFGLIGLLYVYFTFFLGPLSKSRNAAQGTLNDLEARVASSKSEVERVARLDESARTATKRYEALRALSPEGAPIAWFPPRIKTFFASQQIDRTTARLESTAAFKEKELASWGRYIWTVDIPQADFEFLGQAVALLENTNPLLSITKLHIHAKTDNPEFQQVGFTASLITDKK